MPVRARARPRVRCETHSTNSSWCPTEPDLEEERGGRLRSTATVTAKRSRDAHDQWKVGYRPTDRLARNDLTACFERRLSD